MSWLCNCPCLHYYTGTSDLKEHLLPNVTLDQTYCGEDCIVVKNGTRSCGTGGVLANTPLAQNKSYWEVQVQSTGQWGVGVAARNANLDKTPLGMDNQTWVLRQDGSLWHAGKALEEASDKCKVEEGDIIGLTYDHESLKFYVNGEPLGVQIESIRGAVYPVVYVAHNAILDLIFADFKHKPPAGFGEILMEQNLL
eukprot:m.22141 g.22141  ORF g.22141 m.22141 type:complete len:196 (-) comp7351_c0_seq2:991-1578(-)